MVFGVVGSLSVLPVFADEKVVIDYYKTGFANADEKLATMVLMYEDYGYQLYFEQYTGEFAVLNTKTGQIMFSNPIDVATSGASENLKAQLLSQIILKYVDNGMEKTMVSFVEAAQREQIIFKQLKGGIRVEYTLGETETRKLVPKMIEKTRFEEQILAYCEGDSQAMLKLKTFFALKDLEDPMLTERGRIELAASYPIVDKMPVYVLDSTANAREINILENFIKQYCPHYTFEVLAEDHALVEFEDTAANPARFKMSLEYYIDEFGLTVRLPANGIRFDESTYSLSFISILPYIGAGSTGSEGYTMIPDGSGAIIRFEDASGGSNYTVSGQLYGSDYAYHEIETSHAAVMRMPVFGLVEEFTELVTTDEVSVDAEGNEVITPKMQMVNSSRGYVAIIEEGDALAKINSEHGGSLHKYHSAYTTFYPRPTDSYNLREAISVASNTSYTVVSERKYTGSYRIRYIMLDDPANAESRGIEDYYETSYVGMAKAYRDLLISDGKITPIEDTNDNIPLYIQTFGVIDTQEVVLSFPMMMKTPLTTFENIKTMYNDLAANGITNINFKLTGFANGGMAPTMPTNVKFEKKVGGNSGYTDLINYAAEKDFGVFPEFELSYVMATGMFDGFSYDKDAVKTIDDRYIDKRVYDSTYQSFVNTFQYAVSPSVFDKFYDKLYTKLAPLGISGVSFGTLGSDLNSDFDTEDPYNREDSKEQVVALLEKISENAGPKGLMINNGNAYAIPYASHVLAAPLDSSRYTSASESIPFFGLVYHSYLNFTGSATNMAGDINYEILKIIENGAAPYFILLYQNTAKLKEDVSLSKYYSISYEIWFEDLIENYNTLNGALKDVKYSAIENHEFIEGVRIPTERELELVLEQKQAALDAKNEAAAAKAAKAEKAEQRKKLQAEAAGQEYIPTAVAPTAPVETVATVDLEQEILNPKYVINDGTIVKVTYANGTYFILNYNSFAVRVGGVTIEPLSFIKAK